MRGYTPQDKEAYNKLTTITQWAIRYRHYDGRLTRALIREYLCMGGAVQWTLELEKRIFQESGRMGAFVRKKNKKHKKKEIERKRQLTLNL